jgi:hypothetical protein
MSDATPHESGMDRRGFIVGGATAFAAGALAPNALGQPAEGESATQLFGADYVDRASAQAVDVKAMETGRVVRVNSGSAVRDFAAGDDVAVVLPKGASEAEASRPGESGPVRARAVTRLVLGDRSDISR